MIPYMLSILMLSVKNANDFREIFGVVGGLQTRDFLCSNAQEMGY
jgi:hypothetical protein